MFHLKIPSLTEKNRQHWIRKEKIYTSSRENRVQTAAVIVLSVIWNATRRMYSMRLPSIINEK